MGIDRLDPEKEEDLAFVDSLEVPNSVVEVTTLIYRYIFWRLTGMKIERYQREKMNIDVVVPGRKIEIVIGSESDLPQTQEGLFHLRGKADFNVNILSCHRNPDELLDFARKIGSRADVIIAGAGMAAALPGIIKSELCNLGHSNIPVIGVAFQGGSEKENTAARLSIECLPGEPVELDSSGEAYFGQPGFLQACVAAVDDEFFPKTIEAKPAQIALIR